ncbi:MAG: type II toxin-antitoxin system VapC family toxin [Sphingomonadaceae bacterium]|nr:type II toxin-antitoxin system VapC family toxin [Sphingomonadaceae bacterium]
MSYLLDTMVLLWMASTPEILPDDIRAELSDLNKPHIFSSISIWEIAIKSALKRPDFDVDPVALRTGCIANDWMELDFTGRHAIAVSQLSSVHDDPFDRALIAQAISEDRILLTSDSKLAKYGESVRLIKRRQAI